MLTNFCCFSISLIRISRASALAALLAASLDSACLKKRIDTYKNSPSFFVDLNEEDTCTHFNLISTAC